eukprot:CAMPEP_0114635372 /NCGR_PEP_ID=MMETSP0168-20121206/16448_1 /TAXON_ID=95228 ORGANISM="Vannella sp., Strain DIVA3 517/6/12" /NCGR_SAMPLE_ID=MMETSP0168 /ASSEMBLY_ACC=CAM_ASM_000044 /LENGTH=210 /DNA_ID=CAMNT_0001847075 /DNA_START=33 /DNA_END=662 /DNA_ORIENTATION=+
MDWQLEYLGATGGVVGREEAVELQLGPAETLRVQPQIWLVGERTMSAKEECSSDGVVIADDHRQVSCLAVGEATVTGKLCNLAQCEVASTNEVVRNAVLGEVLAGCEELIWLEFSFHLALDGAVSEAFPWNVGSKAGRDDGVVRGVDGRAAEHIVPLAHIPYDHIPPSLLLQCEVRREGSEPRHGRNLQYCQGAAGHKRGSHGPPSPQLS